MLITVVQHGLSGFRGQPDQAGELHCGFLNPDFSAVDARHVHQVIDQACQVARLTRQDAVQMFQPGVVFDQFSQQLDHHGNGGQGVAQLVREHGNEKRLQLVGGFSLGLQLLGIDRGDYQMRIGLTQIAHQLFKRLSADEGGLCAGLVRHDLLDPLTQLLHLLVNPEQQLTYFSTWVCQPARGNRQFSEGLGGYAGGRRIVVTRFTHSKP